MESHFELQTGLQFKVENHFELPHGLEFKVENQFELPHGLKFKVENHFELPHGLGFKVENNFELHFVILVAFCNFCVSCEVRSRRTVENNGIAPINCKDARPV